MSVSYNIQALEYATDPNIASVCALKGDAVYEDPNHAGIAIDEAIKVVSKFTDGGISDAVIEEKWEQINL